MYPDDHEFEKKLGEVRINDAINPAHKYKLKEQMLAAFAGQSGKKSHGLRLNHLFAAAAVVVIAVGLLGLFFALGLGSGDPDGEIPRDSGAEIADAGGGADLGPEAQIVKAEGGDQGQESEPLDLELAKMEVLYEAGDVEGLYEMLLDDRGQVRLAAVNYLAKIGDAETLEMLELILEKEKDPEVRAAIKSAFDSTGGTAGKADGGANEPNDVEEVLESIAPLEEQAGGMVVTCVNKATGEPMADVLVRMRHKGMGKNPIEYHTNANGQVRVVYQSAEFQWVRIRAYQPGYVPMILSYYQRDGVKGSDRVPLSYTIPLEPSVEIGGRVVDEQGQGIADVDIKIRISDLMDGELNTNLSNCKAKTDAQGYWEFKMAPADFRKGYFNLKHTEYAHDQNGKQASPEELKAKNVVWVMQKGCDLEGYVVDTSGSPIAGASVFTGESYWDKEAPKTNTDTQGYFRFSGLASGPMNLTIQAGGYAPWVDQVIVGGKAVVLQYVLEPGHLIHGRVVDKNGNPRAGIHYAVDEYKGFRTIQFKGVTDEEGRFLWPDAPAEGAELDFYAQGCMRISNTHLEPSAEEQVLTMYDALRVKGKVTDALTGEPIPKFTLVKGIEWENGGRHWQRNEHEMHQCTNGEYEVVLDMGYYGNIVRIEAEGYAPGVSPVYYVDQEFAQCDFELTSHEGWKGVVYQPDGKPAAGAEVLIDTPDNYATFTNGKRREGDDNPFVRTDEKGEFTLPWLEQEYALGIAHESGWAQLTQAEFEQYGDITLEPWGAVKGQAFEGKEPWRERVSMYPTGHYDHEAPGVRFDYGDQCDGEGEFAFNRVVPGRYRIGRMVKVSANSWSTTDTREIEVYAGQTVEVRVGGVGRPVVGKLIAPSGVEITYWNMGRRSVRSHIVREVKAAVVEEMDYPVPDNIESMSLQEIVDFYKNWQQSEEFKAYVEKMNKAAQQQPQQNAGPNKHYQFMVDEDGSFRVEDVEPGEYQLEVQVFQRHKNGHADYQKPLGKVTTLFTVPQMQQDYLEEPLDLGWLQMEESTWPLNQQSKIKPGESMADMRLKTLDGHAFDLGHYRDRYVLIYPLAGLNIEQPQQGREFADTLHAIQNRYPKTELAIIGFSLFTVGGGVTDYVYGVIINKMIEEYDLPGTIVRPESAEEKNRIVQQYGPAFYSGCYLIGPGGVLADRTNDPQTIEPMIEDAFSGAVMP